MNCATPLVLAALSGTTPAHHPGVFLPPFSQTNSPPLPPASGKALWGSPLDNQISSANFTVGWSDGDGNTPEGSRVLEVLEDAWTALVLDQGWAAPVSSEDYLLRVVLDPSIGHTGYTTLIFTRQFPEGVPLIYLNPDYAAYGTFWEHLATHEFSHMLQYAVRSYSGGASEAWYWEASAEWSVELALPELDVYATQSSGYCDAPELRHDTINGYHEYGMFLFNAWLEEHVLGDGGLLRVWSEAASGDAWLDILETTTGLSQEALWAGFTSALGNDDLRESDLYDPPIVQGSLTDGSTGQLDTLGTDYWRADQEVLVTVEGDAVVGTTSGSGQSAVVADGELVSITSLRDNSRYTVRLSEAPESQDSGNSEETPDTGSSGTTSLPSEEGLACGCRSSPVPDSRWMLLALGFMVQRRRWGVAKRA